MADDPRHPAAGIERPDLAELLADQFAALGDLHPVDPRVVEYGETLVFTFVWPYLPADAVVARSPRRLQFAELRRLLLAEMSESLSEVVQIDRHRTVQSAASELVGDPRHAIVSFTLGATRADEGDQVQGLRNWSAQLRRHARERRQVLGERRAELLLARERLGGQMERLRGRQGS